jgi:hypothetical protein
MAAPAERAAGRKRKSAQPQRRPHDPEDAAAYNSRHLFGRTSALPSASWPPSAGGPSAAGAIGEPSGAANPPPIPAVAELPSAFGGGGPFVAVDEEQLGEAIAQRINTVPSTGDGSGGSGGGGVASASGTSGALRPSAPFSAGGGAAPSSSSSTGAVGSDAPARVDEMSVDEIVQSLLSDPHASAMLSSLSRSQLPAASPAKRPTQPPTPSGGKAPMVAPEHDVPAVATLPPLPSQPPPAAAGAAAPLSATAPAPLATAAAPAAAPAAFPARVNIDSFLNRLHGGAGGGGGRKS